MFGELIIAILLLSRWIVSLQLPGWVGALVRSVVSVGRGRGRWGEEGERLRVVDKSLCPATTETFPGLALLIAVPIHLICTHAQHVVTNTYFLRYINNADVCPTELNRALFRKPDRSCRRGYLVKWADVYLLNVWSDRSEVGCYNIEINTFSFFRRCLVVGKDICISC